MRIIVRRIYIKGKKEFCVGICDGRCFCVVKCLECCRWLLLLLFMLVLFLFKLLFEVEIDCMRGVFLFDVEVIFDGGKVFKFICFFVRWVIKFEIKVRSWYFLVYLVFGDKYVSYVIGVMLIRFMFCCVFFLLRGGGRY